MWLQGGLRSLLRPAPDASAPAPFPILLPARWGLVAAYVALAAFGRFGEWRPLLTATVIAVPVGLLLCEAAFFRARRDAGRELTAYAWIYPAHIVLITLAAATDRNAASAVPVIAAVTVFSSHLVFRAPYVASIGVLGALGVLAAHVVRAGGIDMQPEWRTLFIAIFLLAAGGFGAISARHQEAVRVTLGAALERQQRQAESLRRALRDARESDARLRAFAEHVPAALLVFDGEGRAVFAGGLKDAAASETDQLQAALLQAALLAPGQRAAMGESIQAALAGRPGHVELSIDGRQLTAIVFPVNEGAGAIIFDVTRERALAAQAARGQQTEMLGTLAGGIAHDFNNLLTSILGNVYLLEHAAATAATEQQILGDIRIAGERGAEVVRRLLDYGRSDVEQRESIAVQHLVEETARLASHGLTARIALTVSEGPGVTVSGNFAALQQVLLNLLVNARDATPEGGAVTISWYARDVMDTTMLREPGLAAGSYVSISVSDTGDGISAETLPRIFDPFFTTKPVGKGTGLGLFTSQGIVRAHRGFMEVTTTEGTGSTFRMVLPLARVDTALTGG